MNDIILKIIICKCFIIDNLADIEEEGDRDIFHEGWPNGGPPLETLTDL